MARSLRIQYPGAFLHIMSRGNARQDIFRTNEDRRSFLRLLNDVMQQFEWKCFAYALMDNHYHIFVQIKHENLSQGMRQLNGVYTQRFNKRHGSVGHVVQGRYKSCLVESDAYLLEVVRYIILNPVRAGISDTAGEWPWTSYKAINHDKCPVTISYDEIFGLFGDNRELAKIRFANFIQEGIDGCIKLPSLKGNILGTEKFIETITKGEVLSDDKGHVIEDRLVSRPTLNDIFGHNENDRTKRNELIRFAREICKYPVHEIATYLKMNPSSISRILKKC